VLSAAGVDRSRWNSCASAQEAAADGGVALLGASR